KLTCTASGFTFGDYWMSWIRKAPGKGLEWVASIQYWAGNTKQYSQAVQGRFTISRDNSENKLYLHMSNVKAEGTAMYYCASDTHHCDYDAFDYWGKGTMVTVSSDAKQPAVEIRLPSDADLTNSDFATLLCLISDFAPSDVLVRWEFNGTSVSDALCFNSPAFHSASKLTYALHSSLRLPKSRWWDGSYSCVVTHESSDEPLSATVEHVFGEQATPTKPPHPHVFL
uniref:Ig-like domain-containing protein n=1 Tax=Denticeps clupeoides TaxID=299321 RepID=A0AAY4BS65_9TELE